MYITSQYLDSSTGSDKIYFTQRGRSEVFVLLGASADPQVVTPPVVGAREIVGLAVGDAGNTFWALEEIKLNPPD
jgi:hypothetical protein